MKPILYNHALVVGGSGMLSAASLHLANSGVITSVVGRDPSKIRKMQEHSFVFPGKIIPVISDYTDIPQFIIDVIMTQESYGPVTLAVVWMHDTARTAPHHLAKLLNKHNCKFVHVLGSSLGESENKRLELEKQFSEFEKIDYQQVILGHQIENGESRWLTDLEISDGVVEAIISEEKMITVGRPKPREERP
ncbi:MAG: hypothetical protein HKN92_08970 [Chitinophagales bacterium]|nr:hypothetical protein [Chitinophagales bacterium]